MTQKDGYSSWRLGWHMPELARPSEEYIRQIANKASREIDRQLYGAFTGYTETTEAADAQEPDPLTVANAIYDYLGRRPIMPAVYINEWMPEKDEKGEMLVMGIDTGIAYKPVHTPTATGFPGFPPLPRQKGIVMHPAVYLKIERLLPVGLAVYGLDAVRRYLENKKRALYLATLPILPARLPIAVLTAVMVLIVLLLSIGR